MYYIASFTMGESCTVQEYGMHRIWVGVYTWCHSMFIYSVELLDIAFKMYYVTHSVKM